MSSAVRHTPLTATLLPSCSSFALFGRVNGDAVIAAVFHDALDGSDFFN